MKMSVLWKDFIESSLNPRKVEIVVLMLWMREMRSQFLSFSTATFGIDPKHLAPEFGCIPLLPSCWLKALEEAVSSVQGWLLSEFLGIGPGLAIHGLFPGTA